MFELWNNRLMRIVELGSRTGFLVGLAVVFVCINVFVLSPFQAQLMSLSGGVGVLDLLPWYTPEEAFQRLDVYGEKGRELYLIAEWTGDLVYPAVYSVLFGGIIYRLGGKDWALLSIYSAFIDWGENIMLSVMLVRFPVFFTWVSQLATTLTGLKWALALCNVLMILTFSAIKIKKWWTKKAPRMT